MSSSTEIPARCDPAVLMDDSYFLSSCADEEQGCKSKKAHDFEQGTNTIPFLPFYRVLYSKNRPRSFPQVWSDRHCYTFQDIEALRCKILNK